ncbi:hypothetical protein JOF56_003994 [Kibdelosporangium banguiense]|uniref:Uncharacterized protein n=1 Tax=Kibdelosporangium banguiense TaxID=1365924 RepID=A0ABS4TH28_9PSEU|nr:DUF5829 family protein [Kibdelosporangium banguiense]MBP2323609.1 hypothetical protein [Kibdelosporangium banguiense]
MSIRRMIMVLAAALPMTLVGSAGAQAEESAGQLLYYNHAYGVLDSETAEAIKNSEYLREFANFEVRTTSSGNLTWTGRYLYGRETYLEFFKEGELPGPDANAGATGLAVSADRDGDLATVIDRLPAAGLPNPLPFLQTRDFGDGVRVPWFDGVNTVENYDAFSGWGMEYRDEYFADPRSKTEPASGPGDVSRERYQSDAYQNHLMRNVTGIRMAVTANDLANNLPLLRAGGFSIQTVPNGVIATGGGTTIRFDSVPLEQVGLRRIEFSLNRTITYQDEVRIGRSTLTVGPAARAVWTFDTPA